MNGFRQALFHICLFISLIILILFILFAGIIYLMNNGNPYEKHITNKYIPSYLEEQGYKANDIQKQVYVETTGNLNKEYYTGHHMVIFKDEPNVTYYYGVKKRGKETAQFCERELNVNGFRKLLTRATKHSEANCVHQYKN